MPIYKENNRYIVKISIHGRQILRKLYLGKIMTDKTTAYECERDLYLKYADKQRDYKIDELFNLYEDYLFKKYKETSAKRYLSTFNLVIKKYFVNKNISDITSSYCEFINDSLNSLPYKDIKVYIFITKSFINFLSSYGLKINLSIFYVYKSKRINKKKFNYYTLDEFNKLIDVIESTEDKLIFSLLFYYGLRIGELRGLKLEDCYKDRISINKELSNKGRFGGQIILDPKTSTSNRFYPYVVNIKDLIISLKKEKKLTKQDFLFINKDRDKVIGETTIRRKLDQYSSIANIKRIKIHEFRHSCATYLINKDVDIKDIAAWLGHSSPDVTIRVYAHLLPMRKETIKNVFDETQYGEL